MPSVRFGSAIRKHHEIIRIATGVNAYSQVLSKTRSEGRTGGSHFEHLDVRHAEIQICSVAEDETAAKQYTNR